MLSSDVLTDDRHLQQAITKRDKVFLWIFHPQHYVELLGKGLGLTGQKKTRSIIIIDQPTAKGIIKSDSLSSWETLEQSNFDMAVRGSCGILSKKCTPLISHKATAKQHVGFIAAHEDRLEKNDTMNNNQFNTVQKENVDKMIIQVQTPNKLPELITFKQIMSYFDLKNSSLVKEDGTLFNSNIYSLLDHLLVVELTAAQESPSTKTMQNPSFMLLEIYRHKNKLFKAQMKECWISPDIDLNDQDALRDKQQVYAIPIESCQVTVDKNCIAIMGSTGLDSISALGICLVLKISGNSITGTGKYLRKFVQFGKLVSELQLHAKIH